MSEMMMDHIEKLYARLDEAKAQLTAERDAAAKFIDAITEARRHARPHPDGGFAVDDLSIQKAVNQYQAARRQP